MGIAVKIGDGEELPSTDVSPSWINEQIIRRQKDGVAVCVAVTIAIAGVNLRLTTPACGGAPGGRSPNRQEEAIIDLWKEHKLTSSDFKGGNVVAFLEQLRRIV